jgi:hypothetical protein
MSRALRTDAGGYMYHVFNRANACVQIVQKGYPHGEENWADRMIDKFHLESTSRAPGRPRNGG